jgi:predicted DNA-binding transcriptional regulator AlpA
MAGATTPAVPAPCGGGEKQVTLTDNTEDPPVTFLESEQLLHESRDRLSQSVADPGPETDAVLLSELRQLRHELSRLRAAIGAGESLLLDAAETARLSGMSRSSLYRSLACGQFPSAIQSPAGPRWRRSQIVAWAEKLGGERP